MGGRVRGAGAFLVLAGAIMAGGCVASGTRFTHGFDFGIPGENPGVTILDYRYGDIVFASSDAVATGAVPQSDGSYGNFPPAEFMYVKWRNSVGKVFDRKIVLKGKLPVDMTEKQIHFDILNDELRVFVISRNEKHAAANPDCPVRGYRLMQCQQIFPSKIN